MSSPYLTIVTPVYNAAATLRRTLDALMKQKADFEHLVCDGGSTDATVDIVREYEGKYPVRLLKGDKLGVYVNVADAFREARGQVFGWINGDDFYLPWTLPTVARIFTAYPDRSWITGIPSWFCEGEELGESVGFAPIYFQSLVARGWYRRNRLGCLQQESQFWRRDLYERAGGDQVLRAYRYAADYHLWRKFAEHAPLQTVSAVLACFTVRPGQFSAVNSEAYNRECGCAPGDLDLATLGKIFGRLASVAFRHRPIRPRTLSSHNHPMD